MKVNSTKTVSSQRAPAKQVALIIECEHMPRRQMLTGVAQYIQEHQSWAVYLNQNLYQVKRALGDWLKNWDGDGIIAAIHEGNSELFTDLRIPVVDVAGMIPDLNVPLIHANDIAIGKMGAEHLCDRGFTHFAFCVKKDMRFSLNRLEGFNAVLRERDFTSSVYELDSLPISVGPKEWKKQQELLAAWIRALPKPIGIMASTDLIAQQILEACMRVGIHVPDEIAVLGADNDMPICNICTPPLSSIIINDHQRGYEAAALLDRLMSGEVCKSQTVLIEPSGVACRASTDILAINDDHVTAVLQYIRQNASSGINVKESVKKVPISRRVLERRFSKLVGRSIHEEITRVRLNHAVELLTGTDLDLKVIAYKAGFGSQSYMNAVFRSDLNCTPGSYRSQSKRKLHFKKIL